MSCVCLCVETKYLHNSSYNKFDNCRLREAPIPAMEFVFVVGDFCCLKNLNIRINTFKIALEKQDFVVEFCEGTTAQEKQEKHNQTHNQHSM